MPWRGSKRSSADMVSIYWTHLLHRVDRGDDRAMPSSSDTYLHGHHDSVLRSHRWRTAENSAGYLLPRLAPDARVLDVGCGPGTITADLAARVPGRRGLGLRLVLHGGRGPGLVGHVMGRTADEIAVRRPIRRARAGHPGRSRAPGQGLAALGGQRGRLVPHPARRSSGSGV